MMTRDAERWDARKRRGCCLQLQGHEEGSRQARQGRARVPSNNPLGEWGRWDFLLEWESQEGDPGWREFRSTTDPDTGRDIQERERSSHTEDDETGEDEGEDEDREIIIVEVDR